DLPQAPVAKEIEAAVPGPGAGVMRAEEEKRDDGGGDRPAVEGPRLEPQGLVHRVKAVPDLAEKADRGGRRHDLVERLDDEAARAVAGMRAADPVRDGPEAEIG